jgi:hypothetical protein
VPGRLDPGLRLFAEGVQHPDIFVELYRIHRPKGVTPVAHGDLEHAGAEALMGLAVSAFSPCAAMRNANMTRSCTDEGNVLKSRNAPLTHVIRRMGGFCQM